jgi:hypothetical protein
MAAFTRTQADGTWITGYAILPADIADLERKAFHGINGDLGGSYTPTAELFVQGNSVVVTGPTEVRQEGVITGGVTLVGDIYEKFAEGHVNRSRTIWQACTAFAVVGPRPWAALNSLDPVGIQFVASGITTSTELVIPEFTMEMRVHDGATLSSVRVRLRVPTPHGHVPTTMPRIRIGRLKYDGSVSYLKDTPFGDGFTELPRAASGAAWYNNGEVQEFDIVCDQNNVIDVSQYSYFINVVEAVGGVGYPFQLKIHEGVDVYETFYEDEALPTGVTPGFVHLLTANTDARENGLYLSDTSTRHTSLDSETEFENGKLIVADSTVLQMFIPPSFTLGVSSISIVPIVPRGTIFLGFFLDFTDIADNRFQ